MIRFLIFVLALFASPALAQTAPAPTANVTLAGNAKWTSAPAGKSIGGVDIRGGMDIIPYANGKDGWTVHDVRVGNVRAFITPDPKIKGVKSANNVTIERIEATCREWCIYIRGTSHDWTIRDFAIHGAGNTPYAAGIALKDSAHDIVIERGLIDHQITTLPKGYPNRDGIVAERGNSDLTVRDVTIRNITDGAIDSKAANTRLENLLIEDVGKGVRLWSTFYATTLTIRRARVAFVHLPATTSNGTIEKLVAVGSAPLLRSEYAAARVTILSCDLTGWTGKVKLSGRAKVTWGNGC